MQVKSVLPSIGGLAGSLGRGGGMALDVDGVDDDVSLSFNDISLDDVFVLEVLDALT